MDAQDSLVAAAPEIILLSTHMLPPLLAGAFIFQHSLLHHSISRLVSTRRRIYDGENQLTKLCGQCGAMCRTKNLCEFFDFVHEIRRLTGGGYQSRHLDSRRAKS